LSGFRSFSAHRLTLSNIAAGQFLNKERCLFELIFHVTNGKNRGVSEVTEKPIAGFTDFPSDDNYRYETFAANDPIWFLTRILEREIGYSLEEVLADDETGEALREEYKVSLSFNGNCTVSFFPTLLFLFLFLLLSTPLFLLTSDSISNVT